MPRKKDRRHDNPGRPYTGRADKEHKVRVSAELDDVIRVSIAASGLTAAEWWRQTVEALISDQAKKLIGPAKPRKD